MKHRNVFGKIPLIANFNYVEKEIYIKEIQNINWNEKLKKEFILEISKEISIIEQKEFLC
jgi:hypothetical protein